MMDASFERGVGGVFRESSGKALQYISGLFCITSEDKERKIFAF